MLKSLISKLLVVTLLSWSIVASANVPWSVPGTKTVYSSQGQIFEYHPISGKKEILDFYLINTAEFPLDNNTSVMVLKVTDPTHHYGTITRTDTWTPSPSPTLPRSYHHVAKETREVAGGLPVTTILEDRWIGQTPPPPFKAGRTDIDPSNPEYRYSDTYTPVVLVNATEICDLQVTVGNMLGGYWRLPTVTTMKTISPNFPTGDLVITILPVLPSPIE